MSTATRYDYAFLSDLDCKLNDSAVLRLGDGTNAATPGVGDAALQWDGTNLALDCTTDDSLFEIGNGTQSWDVKWFGATSGDFLYFDASANLLYTTDVDVQFKDNDVLVFGTGAGATGDMQMRWDGVDFDILPTADDSVIKFGNGTLNFDIQMLAGASDYWEFDASEAALCANGDVRLDFTAATTAAGNTDGGIIKAGTSGSRVTEDTADMKFVSFYFDNGATSGDNRGIYNRLYLTGAGGGGESLRSFTTVEDVAGGTAHGAHISLGFGSTGSITGLGVASRNTLHVPDQAMTGGTYAATQCEIWADGSSSDTGGMTELSFLRCVVGGDADGLQDTEDDAFLLTLTGGTVGAGNIMAAKSAAAVTHTIRMKGPDGATYYLMVSDTQ